MLIIHNDDERSEETGIIHKTIKVHNKLKKKKKKKKKKKLTKSRHKHAYICMLYMYVNKVLQFIKFLPLNHLWNFCAQICMI